MADDDALPPHVTPYKDRHGKQRYRFRRAGMPSRDLPGEPGSPEFRKVHALALAGVPRKAKRPARFEARTLAAAWAEVRESQEWRKLKPISQGQQSKVAERFLAMPIAPKEAMTFGQMPFSGFRRPHVKAILKRYEHPHAAEAVLRFLRKLSLVALDLEWIENDPTHRVKFRPKLIGHRAWKDAEHTQFEARFPIGTRERLGYALALYTGQRRGDVAAMAPTDLADNAIAVKQDKTGVPLWIPVHPELRAVLDVTDLTGPAIFTGAWGGRYTRESFGNFMADAIDKAGLPADCRLHGLRKSAGRCLAEAGATTRMIMAVLGHKTIKEAERYTREAEQRGLAQEGIERWAKPRLQAVK